MRLVKTLLILLISINSCFSQQTWGSLTSGQCVSWGAITDATTNYVFQIKNALPTNGLYRLIERDSIAYYIYIDTVGNAGFASRGNKQLIWQSDLTPYLPNTITVYDSALNHSNPSGWYSSALACDNYLSGRTDNLSYNTSLSIGTVINCCWTDKTYVYNGGNWYYLRQNAYSGYYIAQSGSCPVSYAFTFNNYPTTYGSCTAARAAASGGTSMYASINTMSTTPTPTITKFYTDPALSIPFVGAGAGTYYSISIGGVKYGCQIDSGGNLLSFSSSC